MKQKRYHSRLLSLGLCVLLVLSLFTFPPAAKADVVTDTLDVCVGYFGMELSDYVTVGSYHWSELEQNLPPYAASYSYYNSGTFADEYTAVVDTARGFTIKDLLSYANVYYGDIDTILFYVKDAEDIWVSFDREELFRERYYFDDLPGHRKIIYGTKEVQAAVEKPVTELQQVFDPETGEPEVDADGNAVYEEVQTGTETVYETQTVTDYSKIEGYDFSDAWNDAQIVEPMLALEDNWAAYNEEFEHIRPDDSYMNTGSRFRLLFGQLEPTESRTHDSAKYVSRVYVTLTGSPHISEDSLQEQTFDTTIGSSGTIELEINNIYDQDMTDALRDYLHISSEDDAALRIDSYEISGTDYKDLAKVTIHYTVTGDVNGTLPVSVKIGTEDVAVGDSSGNAVTNTDGSNITLTQKIQDIIATNADAEPGDDTGGSGSGSGGDAPDEVTPTAAPQSTETPAAPSPSASAEPSPAAAPAAADSGNTAQPTASQSPAAASGTAQTTGSGSAAQTAQAAASPQPSDNGSTASGTDTGLLTAADGSGTDTDALTPDNQDDALLMADDNGSLAGRSSAFLLSPGAASQLTDDLPATELVPVTEEVTELEVADTSEEEDAEEKRMLLLTCLGLLGILLLGGGAEYLSYRFSVGRLALAHKKTSKAKKPKSP